MKTLYKLSILFLKYAPMIGAFIMWMHVLHLLCGYTLFIAENLFGLPAIPCIIGCLWSKAFKFCTIHRLFITYMCLVTYCINWHSIVGFGMLLTPFRWVVLGIGVILFIWLIVKKLKYKIILLEDE